VSTIKIRLAHLIEIISWD